MEVRCVGNCRFEDPQSILKVVLHYSTWALASGTHDRMLTPPPLKHGDLIRVVAPSSRFDRTRFDAGIACLKERGFRVAFRDDIYASSRYLAGDDERRASELREALADDEAQAVWCARGGYGAQRLFPLLETFELSRPKWLVGFSDITALHGWVRRRGYQSLHGPNVTTLPQWSSEAVNETFELLTDSTWRGWTLQGASEGVDAVEGRLIGGNLTVLASLMGSEEQPFFKNELLCLEDVGERPYRLDRSFEQLRQAGVLDGVAGVILGNFQSCDETRDEVTLLSGLDILEERFRNEGVPVFKDAPFGHHNASRAFRHGELVRLVHDGSGVYRASPKKFLLPGVHT